MVKKVTTLNLDAELIQKARARGVNISQLTNRILQGLFFNTTEEGIKLDKANEELEEIRQKKEALITREIELLTLIKENEEKMRFEQEKEDREANQMMTAIKNSGLLEEL